MVAFRFVHVLRKDRVIRQLHLVDGDALGCELQRLLDAILPVVPGLTHHACDEVDVHLLEAEFLAPAVGFEDFRGTMGSAIDLEDAVIKVLDAQAQSGNT